VFDKKIEINLYRIIQEAVNNIIRHSQATEAIIAIKKNIKYVTISIRDDGKGFYKNNMLKETNSLGLVGMYERTKLIGGRCTIKSNPPTGTEIEIRIPIPNIEIICFMTKPPKLR